ncbi:MAG: peptidylprolyl isomerase [Deltaproteobacteria bacterium]|nr:peptidylprolyl isomerase [Deltaproteobacteria bacterium]
MRTFQLSLITALTLLTLHAAWADKPGAPAPAPAKAPDKSATKNPVVEIKTSLGLIKAELFMDKAPLTVKNFLEYVDAKHYDGTIFHRVIKNFMIQGGGYDASMKERSTRAPVRNEAGNGLKNEVGTLAMARTSNPDSATAQFYINTVDNAPLNRRDETPAGAGYTVFGKVISGLEIVKKVESVPTGTKGMMDDVPQFTVTIESIRRAK